MGKTEIEWTDFSINPIRARDIETGAVGHFCIKCSVGCANCYSERFQPRVGLHEFTVKNQARVETFLDEDKLQEVIKRKKPTKYFWCDMTDMFGDWVLDEWIDKCFATMALTPQHTHQVLTKRAERMRLYIRQCDWGNAANYITDKFIRPLEQGLFFDNEIVPPLSNVWLGVSVENQSVLFDRVGELLRIDAAVRFISAEPLLGPLDFVRKFEDGGAIDILDHAICPTCDGESFEQERDCSRCGGGGEISRPIDWIIGGGESGPKARPCHPEWARKLRDDCEAHRIPFFWKQWGEWLPGSQARHLTDEQLTKFKGQSLDSDGVSSWQFRTGKHAAGRLLDGREYNEFPL